MMKRQLIAGIAAVALGATTLAAQTAKPATGRGGTAQAKNEVTIVGCVEFEQDYRKRMAAGRGGVLGSGAGAADEFVITNVRPADAPKNAGGGGGVYSVTGTQEKNLKRDVGRQVEIVGMIENAGKPSTGAELKDISDLPRINISTWHPVGDFCPAK